MHDVDLIPRSHYFKEFVTIILSSEMFKMLHTKKYTLAVNVMDWYIAYSLRVYMKPYYSKVNTIKSVTLIVRRIC